MRVVLVAACAALGGCDLILLNENITSPPPPVVDAAPDAPPRPPFCFGDKFDAPMLDTARWQVIDPAASLAVLEQRDGALRVRLDGSIMSTGDAKNGVFNQAVFDFTDAVVEVAVQPANLDNPLLDTVFVLDAAGSIGTFTMRLSGGLLYMSATNQVPIQTPYKAGTRALRMVHLAASSEYVFESELAGQWREEARYMSTVKPTAVRVQLYAESRGGGGDGSEAIFDEVTLYAKNCVN